MTRLSSRTLTALPADIAVPAYDRSAVSAGIVHLGVGAFHRAHQAVYCDDVLNDGAMEWGIAGVSLRSPALRDALLPQDRLYTVCSRSGAGDDCRIVGSLTDLLVAPEDPARVLAVLSAPETRIVTLTVTEKGYCHDPASGDLVVAHPDIAHDLDNPESPRSVPGYLVEAIRRRRAEGLPAFTVLSCDNLPANGRTAKRILHQFAGEWDADLAAYVEAELACPSTMVDRIVPATTDGDKKSVAARLGVADAWPIATEPFCQWVVEDRFPAGRPHWDRHGAQIVKDVEPYELMKLRLLNGSHSTIAYLGYLSGHETVADAMADTMLAGLVRRLMDEETTPTLPALPEIDLDGYKAALLERFANPALRHRTWQIAMDGSQKLPQRLLDTIRRQLAHGAPFAVACLAVAAWIRYTSGRDETGEPIDVRDPLAPEFERIHAKAGSDPVALANGFCAVQEVFGRDLPQDGRFVAALTGTLRDVLHHGVRAAMANTIRGGESAS